ncbi:hypothetical protein Dda_6473 [Drechslerella dactyloides]|uniref:Uncharacterized protein n=1 Tax=Drechslerella dactyloides TaxID=74499 RepID=A0AAD6ITV5_DREDA|nr:hypothetical protein Dda_6473 [Drechslerella dactyloides]
MYTSVIGRNGGSRNTDIQQLQASTDTRARQKYSTARTHHGRPPTELLPPACDIVGPDHVRCSNSFRWPLRRAKGSRTVAVMHGDGRPDGGPSWGKMRGMRDTWYHNVQPAQATCTTTAPASDKRQRPRAAERSRDSSGVLDQV